MDHLAVLQRELRLGERHLRLPPGSLPRGTFRLLEEARCRLNIFTRFELKTIHGPADLHMEPRVLAPALLEALQTDMPLEPYSLAEFMKYYLDLWHTHRSLEESDPRTQELQSRPSAKEY